MTNDQDPTRATFQVVLIDICKAANQEIQCVKKPLTEDLKYVAISYRWGELEETNIDTGVGYLASITSFDIQDFYRLCKTMTKEPTMRHIPYVWVDAICVNQSNHDERKATIYHMTDIYEFASWILAVPDLHAAHLRMMHQNDLNSLQRQEYYLYHLLHNHTNEIYKINLAFFDDIGVPQDQTLRHNLKGYTFFSNHFTFESSRLYFIFYNVATIRSLYESETGRSCSRVKDWRNPPIERTQLQLDDVDWLHEYFKKSGHWIGRIIERSIEIRQAIPFLTNLVVDWSSRVWVISECHISKKKNNLKFWFNELDGNDITFFKFDKNDPLFTKDQTTKMQHSSKTLDPVYFTFYEQVFNQLNRQSFLEMMLKSKASKNEDRFHAIFPFFSKYKHLLQQEELVTNVNSILSVKLKLYQVMTNEDKVLLFYLASKGTKILALPTFATSAIRWQERDAHKNVDLERYPMHITLLYQNTVGYYLRVKATNIFIFPDVRCSDDAITKTLNRILYPKTLPQDNRGTFMDKAFLHAGNSRTIMLIGSLKENTWILNDTGVSCSNETIRKLPNDFPGFHVY